MVLEAVGPLPVTDRRFRAMGSDIHLIVVGGPEGAADAAQRRIHELEGRWSRFLPDSEISVLNRRAGEWVTVSADTRLLVARGVDAFHLSGACVDPTVLAAVVAAGYDRSFDRLPVVTAPASPVPVTLLGCEDIEMAGDAVRLPAGLGFDPGGIGKGVAADLVVTELRHAGVEGVCVNMGGDVRVEGTSPTGGAWSVAVEHPWSPVPMAVLHLAAGGVATSTTLKRVWFSEDGLARHHLIDPGTGLPSTTDLNMATVVAGEAWEAEVLAKAVLLRGAAHRFDLLGGTTSEALVVGADGQVRCTGGLRVYLDRWPVPGVTLDLGNEMSAEADGPAGDGLID